MRARFAEARGLGCLVRHCAEFDLPAALERMSDPDGRAEMRSAHLPHADKFKRNGAQRAADAIASLCETHIVRE